MDFSNRSPFGPTSLHYDGSNPEPFYGAQKIIKNGAILWKGRAYSNSTVIDAYGLGRVRLMPSTEVRNNNLSRYGSSRVDRGLYLHGKRDDHNYTHGCVCDKSEKIFNYLWNNINSVVPFYIKVGN